MYDIGSHKSHFLQHLPGVVPQVDIVALYIRRVHHEATLL